MFLKRELALVAVTQAGTYIPAAGKEWLFTIKFNIKLSMQKNRDSAKKMGWELGYPNSRKNLNPTTWNNHFTRMVRNFKNSRDIPNPNHKYPAIREFSDLKNPKIAVYYGVRRIGIPEKSHLIANSGQNLQDPGEFLYTLQSLKPRF